MIVKHFKVYLGLTLLLLGPPCFAAASSAEYMLPNGLKIIVQSDHRAPVVVSQIWYRVGSAHERDGITGISHVLEHMMFKATKTIESGAFSRIVSERGGTENAFTATDFTAYYQQWSPGNLDTSFRMEADRMKNLILDSAEFVQERAVVLEERSLRVDDKPISMAYEVLKANAFMTSPYRYPVIGWRSDIEDLTISDLRYWYDRYYHPNNATIVVVGDISAADVFEMAEKHFGSIPKGPEIISKSRPEIIQNGGKRITYRSSKANVPHLIIGYKVPSYKQAIADETIKDWEPFALEVLATVLGGFEGARLESSVVRESRLAASTNVSYSWATLLPDLFTVSAIPRETVPAEKLEEALKKELVGLIQSPPDERELKKVIAQTLAESIFQLDSIAYRAILIGTLDSVGLDWKLKDEYINLVKSVTSDQVAYVAKKYLTSNSETVVHLVPANDQ